MKIVLFSIGFLLIILTSCSNKSDNNYDLISIEKIHIAIGSTVSPFFFQSQYLNEQNQIVIANRNLDDESLLILDLNKRKIIKKINYQSEGVNDVQGSSSAFYYHNKDSIFLIGPYNKKFYITNEFGEVKSTIQLKDAIDVLDDLGQPLLLMGTSSGFYDDGIMTFVTYPTNAKNMLDSKSDPVIVHFDIAKRKIVKGTLTYENSIRNNIVQHPEYIMPLLASNSDNQLVILFKLSNDFIVYDLEDNSFVTKPFKSDFFDTYDKMKTYDQIPDFLIESYSNKKMVFNEANNHLYLFVSHKESLIDDEKNKNSIHSKPFSVLVFNKNYEKIYEERFAGSLYNVELSFINNTNLFLSLNNPENESFDENYFNYEVFELKQKL